MMFARARRTQAFFGYYHPSLDQGVPRDGVSYGRAGTRRLSSAQGRSFHFYLDHHCLLLFPKPCSYYLTYTHVQTVIIRVLLSASQTCSSTGGSFPTEGPLLVHVIGVGRSAFCMHA